MSWLDWLNPFYRKARRERDAIIADLRALWDNYDDKFRRELMIIALQELGGSPDWNSFYRLIRDARDTALSQLGQRAYELWEEL